MARTTIHLMRHGEVHNSEGILYGRLPGYHLSELGRQMALQVADVSNSSFRFCNTSRQSVVRRIS